MKCKVYCDGNVTEFEVREGLTDNEICYIAWGHLYKKQMSYDCDDDSMVEVYRDGRWEPIYGG